jgi:V8-like Glu-specific endopeptidase
MAALAGLAVAALACGSDGSGSSKQEAKGVESQPINAAVSAINVPSNWIGSAVGVAAPKLVPVGKVNIIAPPAGWHADEPTYVEDTSPPSIIESQLAVVTPDGTQSSLSLSAREIKTIAEYMTAHGMNGASGPGVSDNVPKGWANGVDDRVRWTYNSSNDFPRRTIGLLYTNKGGGSYTDCTATLFSNELVLTAALCLWPSAGNLVWPTNFQPGQDGSTSVSYGSYSLSYYWYETGWTNNNCSDANLTKRARCTIGRSWA